MDTTRQRRTTAPGAEGTGAGVAAPRRIGLLGPECSGKTTLARDLAGTLPACLVDEELRAFVDTQGRTPRRGEQAGILERQAAREEKVAEACRRPWLIADPAPLMTAVYSLEYFDDPGLLERGLSHARAYHLLIWCAPDLPWEPDGEMRDGPDRRASTDATIARVLQAAEVEGLPPVLRAEGSPAHRVRSVTSSLGGGAGRQAWQPGDGA